MTDWKKGWKVHSRWLRWVWPLELIPSLIQLASLFLRFSPFWYFLQGRASTWTTQFRAPADTENGQWEIARCEIEDMVNWNLKDRMIWEDSRIYIWPWGFWWKGKVDNPWMIQVRNNKRLSLPSSMPKIYAKLKLIMPKESANSHFFRSYLWFLGSSEIPDLGM